MTNVINELHTDLYINGEWVTTSDKKDVINPATGETIAQIAQADETQVEEAIQAAHKAFPAWKELELKDRVAYLHKIAD